MEASQQLSNIVSLIKSFDIRRLWEQLTTTNILCETTKYHFLNDLSKLLEHFKNKGDISLKVSVVEIEEGSTQFYFFGANSKKYFSLIAQNIEGVICLKKPDALNEREPKELLRFKRLMLNPSGKNKAGLIGVNPPNKIAIKALNDLVFFNTGNVLKVSKIYAWVVRYKALHYDYPINQNECNIYSRFNEVYKKMIELLRLHSYHLSVEVAFNDDRFIDLEIDDTIVIKWLLKYEKLFHKLSNIDLGDFVRFDSVNEVVFIEELYDLELYTKDFRDIFLFKDKYEHVFTEQLEKVNGAPNLMKFEKERELRDADIEKSMKSFFSAQKFLCLFLDQYST